VSFRPRLRPALLAALAALASLVVALVLTSGAGAVPGDPPITTKAPASGSTVPANDLGMKVEFGCPAYTKSIEDEGDDDEKPKAPKRVAGGLDDYGVRFSTSPARGGDGLLTTAGFGEEEGEGEVDAASDHANCTSELDLPEKPVPADLYSGTIYWQAYRACESCGAAEYEAGPVNSMIVVPNVEDPELEPEDHLYAGFLTKVSFSTGAELSGATLVLQRWNGTEWIEVEAIAASADGEADYFVKFPKPARTALRVAITAPGVFYPLEPRKVTIQAPGKKHSVGVDDDGAYLVPTGERKSAPAHFKVADDGQVLVGLRARVEARCTTGAASTTTFATVAVKRAHIAPDGSVTAERHTTGPTPALVTLAGNLHEGHFSGELTTSFLNCTGTRQVEADLGGVPHEPADPAG
jgi:hypothetical protein